MTSNKLELISKAKQALNSIDVRTISIVSGFIHDASKKLVINEIPDEIISFCLLFYYIFPEQFNDNKGAKNIILASTNFEGNCLQTLNYAVSTTRGLQKGSVFGSFIIDAKRDKNLVFQWRIKGGSYFGIIGLEDNFDSDILNGDCFKLTTGDYHYCTKFYSRIEAKSNFVTRHHPNSSRIDGKLNALYAGDIVNMILDVGKGTIMFRPNGNGRNKTVGFEGLSLSGKYIFAAVLCNEQSIEILNFKIYSQKQYKEIMDATDTSSFPQWIRKKDIKKKSKAKIKKFRIKTKSTKTNFV